jgi:hypothetical protein
MSPGETAKDRPLTSDDPALHLGWKLLDFLASIGADEFVVTFMCWGDEYTALRDRLVQKLTFASLGERTSECTVMYTGQCNPRPVEVWRLDVRSCKALRGIMPDGVLGPNEGKDAWVEDLCVYRRGELVFGTVTHEQYAFLRLTDAEWRQCEAPSDAARRAT